MFSHRLVEAQATERRHLARELHDEIGQSLTVMQLYLQQCYSRTAPTT
jgi:signal transduction histidine kinase